MIVMTPHPRGQLVLLVFQKRLGSMMHGLAEQGNSPEWVMVTAEEMINDAKKAFNRPRPPLGHVDL